MNNSYCWQQHNTLLWQSKVTTGTLVRGVLFLLNCFSLSLVSNPYNWHSPGRLVLKGFDNHSVLLITKTDMPSDWTVMLKEGIFNKSEYVLQLNAPSCIIIPVQSQFILIEHYHTALEELCLNYTVYSGHFICLAAPL